MESVGIARALTYNKLGALQGWGLNWKKADPIIRKIIHPKQLGIPSKLFEWLQKYKNKGVFIIKFSVSCRIYRYTKTPLFFIFSRVSK